MHDGRPVRPPAFTSHAALALAVVLAEAAALAGPAPLAAQTAAPTGWTRDPGGYPFRTPVGSPLEPAIRLGLAHVSRDTASRLVALPDLGDRLSFWLRRRPSGTWELAGAVAGGVFSRFDLETEESALIEIRYRAALQLRARFRGLAGRAELYHASSHLGDEHLLRTERAPISTSREGLELLVQGSPRSGWVAYGGPGFILRSTRDLNRLSLRGGVAWEGGPPGRLGSAPFASLDLFLWSERDWRPALAAELGVRFGSRARLAATLGTGPSRAEQFSADQERFLGLLFSFVR